MMRRTGPLSLTYGLIMVLLAAGLIGLGVSVHSDQSQTRRALCVFRADLQQRVDSTERYLAQHPNGFLGVPVATIRASLHNQRLTIESLMSLHC